MNAVVTYIFGKDAEILREPLVVDPDVDYICVTDQPSLTSEHWRIVVDDLPHAKCTRDKMPMVKYNPFKYTNADRIIVLDGTLQLTGSLNALFEQLDAVPLLVKKHPERNTLNEELDAWVIKRRMNPKIVASFKVMADVDGIVLDREFLIESCILGFRNVPAIHKLCYSTLAYMQFLGNVGNDGKLCMTNQCPLTYLVQKMNIEHSWIDQSLVATRYRHNSWVKADR